MEDIEKALEAAFLGVSGMTVKVQIDSMTWDEATSSVKVALTGWDKISIDPFAGAI